MLKGKSIFILGTAKFDGPYESTSFTIANYLAHYNKVYYVDYPFTWRDYHQKKQSKQFKDREKLFLKSSNGIIKTNNQNLNIVITPPVYPINFIPEGKFYRCLLSLNQRIIAKRIQKIIKADQITEVIYINSHNFHYPDIAQSINPILQVYHCVDPLIAAYDRKHGVISEDILVKNSDVVVCTSKQLYEEKKVQNLNTFFIPNAADITHSSKVLDEEMPIHPAIKNIPKPIIGYFGNIERRIDYQLLQKTIETNPDKSFVFAGPVIPGFVPEWFYATSNVYFTGRLPYQDMPSMVKGFDVAIIPFKKDAVSRTIFPLKLFEYLGAGKPVVAIDFNPDLIEFTKDTVAFCADAATFSTAINEALMDTEEKKKARILIAAENTWEKRGAEFSELLNAALKNKLLTSQKATHLR